MRLSSIMWQAIPRLQRALSTSANRLSPTTKVAVKRNNTPIDRFAEYTRDEQILSPYIRVKNEDDTIGPSQHLDRVLRNIDRKTHTVVQLAANFNGSSDSLVQIYALMDLLKKVRDKENRAKDIAKAARERKPKQIELNWAISDNDLDLKLKQLEAFLEKGRKVEILFAARKRQRKATQEEGHKILECVRAKISDLGAKEIAPMEGQVLKQVTLVIKKS